MEYSTPVYILRPVHAERGNHRIFYDINNRGDLIALSQCNDAPPSNDPTSVADAGNGHLMRQGYTIVFSGWDISAPSEGHRLAMSVPVARNVDGTPVVGLSLEEFVVDGPGVLEGRLSYPALTQSQSQAVLTVRSYYEDQPEVVPSGGWEYVDDRRIHLSPAGVA